MYRTAIDDAAQYLDDIHGTFGGDMLRVAREEVLRLPELDPADLDDGDFLRCPQNGSAEPVGGHGASRERAEAELPF